MQHVGCQRLLASLLLVAGALTAETVVLRNGFRLQADRHVPGAGTMRLLLANGGWVEVSASEVERVEPDAAIRPQKSRDNPGASAAAPRGSEGLPDHIDRFASLHGLPRELVRAVIRAESGERQDAVSAKGAIGLMQLMPGTAAELGVDPTSVAGNIEGGTRYLRQMLDRYEGHGDQLVRALAAYNAGPGSVAEHDGLPPYAETVEYVARVVRSFLDASPTRSDGSRERGSSAQSPHGSAR